MHWDTDLYDSSHHYVSKFGASLVDWLELKPGQKVLDLGCGTGDLAAKLAERGAEVLGIDNSQEMIEGARLKYPRLGFEVQEATAFQTSTLFDYAFSNAALHWVLDQKAMLQRVYGSLRPGGTFVAEMGGHGNILGIREALVAELDARRQLGLKPDEVWYFPKPSAYCTLLEEAGFRVEMLEHYDRPTPLEGAEGMLHWLRMFAARFVEHLPQEEQTAVLQACQVRLKASHYTSKTGWSADYVRLRFKARKPF